MASLTGILTVLPEINFLTNCVFLSLAFLDATESHNQGAMIQAQDCFRT